MTKLAQRMREELVRRNYAERLIDSAKWRRKIHFTDWGQWCSSSAAVACRV